MRKTPYLLFIAALVVISETADAQFIEKGSLIGGGSFSFSTGTSKSDGGFFDNTKYSQTSFGVTPTVQYYVADNLGIGGNLSLGLSSTKNNDVDYFVSSTSITFGPVIRYYISEGPFFQGSIGFGFSKLRVESGGNNSESKYDAIEGDVAFGYSVKVTDSILFDPTVGYEFQKADGSSDYSGFSIRAGFTMILKK